MLEGWETEGEDETCWEAKLDGQEHTGWGDCGRGESSGDGAHKMLSPPEEGPCPIFSTLVKSLAQNLSNPLQKFMQIRQYK